MGFAGCDAQALDGKVLRGHIAAIGGNLAKLLDLIHAFHHLREDGVLSVEMGRGWETVKATTTACCNAFAQTVNWWPFAMNANWSTI